MIIIDKGIRYREEGWTSLDKATVSTYAEKNALFPLVSTTETTIIFISSEWWGEYNYKIFNVGKSSGGAVNQDPYATANSFRIYIPKDTTAQSYSKLDWSPAQGYWHSTSDTYNSLITNASISPNFVSSSVQFTKTQIPVGSIITIKPGYKYRPEGWINGAKNENSARPVEIETSTIFVTDAWWGNWTTRAFNVSKTAGGAISLEEGISAFNIYVPGTYSSLEKAMFAGGGTSTNPYQIKTAEDMWNLSRISAGKNYGSGLYFKLMNNIDLSAKVWQPICYNGYATNWPGAWYAFGGTFDGNGKTITINGNLSGNGFSFGLFAGLSGTVKNLTINGTINTNGFCGAVAGRAFNGALVEGVTSNVNITANNNSIGGLIGVVDNNATLTVNNCKNTGTITTNSSTSTMVGGLVGGGWATIIVTNSTNTGNVTAGARVGGIVGEICKGDYPNCSVTGCSNSGTIKAGTTVATVDNGVYNNTNLGVGKIIGNYITEKSK